MPYTFVLVHGAWHGGWCWRRVAERLRGAGHTCGHDVMVDAPERLCAILLEAAA
jgi:hypothetical protein